MAERAGMSYGEARNRVMRIASSKHGHPQAKSNIIHSIVNQARIRDGAGAAREIYRELSSR